MSMGYLYFDREKDKKQQNGVANERNRLIQKALSSKRVVDRLTYGILPGRSSVRGRSQSASRCSTASSKEWYILKPNSNYFKRNNQIYNFNFCHRILPTGDRTGNHLSSNLPIKES